ncbi:hypothetical protein PPERSA_06152 [Pseudocohnilembus persalinus]|uniref:Uncharacterized protein n=1 Tax=Pseudocohnilembus persalinus TaxID=266149 RepID=A0A0V0QE91_PSEPJ|nr:hypothetical protein PPERSA_06152 [Pseudocohnilembus persalinus]|eukprot:KRX00509.1 hypothetical protein PPERSA_06152 [Pseudocohnilembus persalinus]
MNLNYLQKKDYYFYTDRASNITTMYYKQNKNDKQFSELVYYPEYLQTKTQNQVVSFQKKMSFKFLAWSVFNKKKFYNQDDYRIALARVSDLNTNILFTTLSCYVIKRFLKRLETPFLEMYFEDKILTLPKIKNIIVGGIFVYSMYISFQSIVSQTYLYDLALEYNKYIYPDLLIQQNADNVIDKYSQLNNLQTQSQQ